MIIITICRHIANTHRPPESDLMFDTLREWLRSLAVQARTALTTWYETVRDRLSTFLDDR